MPTTTRYAVCSTQYWADNLTYMTNRFGTNNFYTQLSLWESAEQRDIIASDEIIVVECFWDATLPVQQAVYINGWITDITNYIQIRTAEVQPFSGLGLPTEYTINGRLRIAEVGVEVLNININNDLNTTSTNATFRAVQINTSALGCRLFGCNMQSTSNVDTILARDTEIINSVVVNHHQTANKMAIKVRGNNATISGCTLVGGRRSVDKDGNTLILNNTVSVNPQLGFIDDLTNLTISNCASSTGATTPVTGVLPIDIPDSDFQDISNGDYRLTGGALVDSGIDTTNLTDIANTIRQ